MPNEETPWSICAIGGNDQVTTQSFEDLNHLFQKSKTGVITEYGRIEQTFNEDALSAVSSWILKVCH